MRQAVQPKRLAWLLGACLLGLGLTLGAAGLFSARSWRGSASVEVAATPATVWRSLVDIEALPKRRPDLQAVTEVARGGTGPRQWRQLPVRGGFQKVEAEDPIGDRQWTLHITDSDDGYLGTWTYRLEPLPQGRTRLMLSEDSHSGHFWVRGLQVLAGRDAGLKRELESLKRSAESPQK